MARRKQYVRSMTTTPRIYVACLASYNNGRLYGEWIDVPSDVDELREEIARILRGSPFPNVKVTCPDCEVGRRGYAAAQGSSKDVVYPCDTCNGTGKVPSAEEWAIHDHEGFEGISISEHHDLDEVVMHAQMLSEHDGAWAAYVGVVGEHYATEDGFTSSYRGEYSSPEDYAEETINDCYDTKSMGTLANYIDYEKFAHDLGFEGYHFVPGGRGVYVFSDT